MYTMLLSAGLGLVEETKTLLDIWEPGMNTTMLRSAALDSGRFPSMTARRLTNIVADCFTPRYLRGGTPAAHYLKRLSCALPTSQLLPLFLLHTCRAHEVLADFIRQVYWTRYATGHEDVGRDEAQVFLERAVADGKTRTQWSDDTLGHVAGYLVGCCADYGLLDNSTRSSRRKIVPFRLTSILVAYLAYDLHSLGVGDNAILEHPDWSLFGLERNEVLEELKRLARRDFLIVQTAGDAIKISWSYSSMEAVCDVLAG